MRPGHTVDKAALAEAVWGDHIDQTDGSGEQQLLGARLARLVGLQDPQKLGDLLRSDRGRFDKIHVFSSFLYILTIILYLILILL